MLRHNWGVGTIDSNRQMHRRDKPNASNVQGKSKYKYNLSTINQASQKTKTTTPSMSTVVLIKKNIYPVGNWHVYIVGPN